MLRTEQPRRGAFDYLLAPLRDEVPRHEPPAVPPERDGRPTGVHIEIEIIDSRARDRKLQRDTRFVTWLVLLAVLLGVLLFSPRGHAQTVQQHQLGGTYYSGTEPNTGPLTEVTDAQRAA